MQFESSELSNNEIAVLDSLHGAPSAVSQRELARRTGLSVGFINAVIKKLVTTGFVKTSHLDRRSIEYLLTPEGFAHAARRSYHYILDTVRSYRTIEARLERIIEEQGAAGIKKIYLNGEGELADFVEALFSEMGELKIKRGLPKASDGKRAVVLNANPKTMGSKKWRVINLIELLREDGCAGNNKFPLTSTEGKG